MANCGILLNDATSFLILDTSNALTTDYFLLNDNTCPAQPGQEQKAAGWIGRPRRRHAHVDRQSWERIKKELEAEFKAAERAQAKAARAQKSEAKQLLKAINLAEEAVRAAEQAQIAFDEIRLRNVLRDAAGATTATQRREADEHLRAVHDNLMAALDDDEAMWIIFNA